MKTLAIAQNTVREALRERLLYNLVVFAIVLIAGSLTISQLTIGEQFRIIADIATSSTQVFGTVIAVFLGVSLVSRELDRRTAYVILARPVSRAQFIVGKYLGLLATILLNVLVMAATTVVVFMIYARGGQIPGGAFLAAFGLLVVQFAICLALAVLFASFSTATLATIFSLTLVGAGHVFSEVRAFWLKSPEAGMKQLVRILDFTLPNMGLLDMKEALTYGDPIQTGSVLARAAYGLGYAGVLVAIAAMVFSRRDVR